MLEQEKKIKKEEKKWYTEHQLGQEAKERMRKVA
jgi:hypothetical protein